MPSKNNSGFTLIEIMVAVAIFAILSSIMILNFRVDTRLKELKNDCQKVVDALKQAQTMALSGHQVNGIIPDGYQLIVPACLSNCSNIYLQTSTTPGITLANIKLDKSEVFSQADVVINFLPPSADSEIWINGISDDQAFIIVKHAKDYSLARCIIYNSISGRIDVVGVDKCGN